jgi:oligopeptide/dipeptide ABC transporter ATP-binding protein
LEVLNLKVHYSNIRVLDSVNLELHGGEIMCLVGESGSGKSTLLHSIMGTLPPSASVSAGSLKLNGLDLLHASKKKLREIRGSFLSMVFQNPDSALCPVVKIKKHFRDIFYAHGAYDKADFEKTVLAMFEKLGLKDGLRILNSYPFELSGGMSQRVCIALACVLRPDFVLADEPTSALDVTTQFQVVTEMKRLRDEFGMGILLVTHNMGVVSNFADKVGVLYAGQLVEFGSTKEVMGNPAHPYTQALLTATPQINGAIPKGIEGKPPRFADIESGCRFAPRCSLKHEACSQAARWNENGGHWCACPYGRLS